MIFSYSGDANFIVTNTTLGSGTMQFTATTSDSFTISLVTIGTIYNFNSVNGIVRLYFPGNVNINPAIGNYEQPTWANITNRVVKIRCSNWGVLRQVILSAIYYSVPQKLNIPFSRMQNLTTFQATANNPYNRITDFDTGLLNLPFFTNIFIGNIFPSDSRFYGVILPEVLNPRLTIFTWTGVGSANSSGTLNRSFTETNWVGINPTSLPLLQNLTLEFSYMGGYDNTEGGGGAYPDVWNTFTTLLTFGYSLSLVTSMPAKMANLPTTLTNLNFQYNNFATSWANLSNLVNLTIINLTGSARMPPTLPIGMINLTKIRELRFADVGRITNPNSDWQNTFYNNLYTFVVANASITGANTLPFRGLTIRTRTANNDSNNMQLVTGVEQAPTGFVLGSSNGTPANAAEMIYVLKVQYGFDITYPQ